MENNLTNKNKAMSIFWWTIKRHIPVSIAYWILLMFALPLIETFMAIVITAESKFEYYVDTMKEAAIYIAGTGFTGIAIFFSIIVGMIAFSYMHNKRSVDFFGSLPVSRRTMFFARYVAIIVITVVPVIIFGSIGACLAGSFAAASDIMKIVAYVILATVGNITIIGFISLCCGSAVDIIISYGAINIAFPICIAVFNFFPSTVIPGMGEELWSASIYTLFCPVASVFTMAFGSGKVFGIIWWILLTAIIIFASFVVCKKRKAEMAQNTYIFSAVEIVVKFIVCALAGLGLGWIMSFASLAHNSMAIQYLYFAIGLVSGIMVANILLHLVFHRGLANFSKSLIQCGIVLIVCGVYTFIIASGLLGYDSDIPEGAQIKGAVMISGYEEEFLVDGKNVLSKMNYDEESIEEIYSIHEEIIEKNKKLQKWWLYPLTGLESFTNYDDLNDLYNNTIIRYELTDGTEFVRDYAFGEVGVKIDKKMYTEVTDEDMIMAIPSKYVCFISMEVDVEGTYTYHEIEINNREIAEALKKDYESNGKIREKDSIGYFSIEYKDENGNYTYAEMDFNETYVNTMETLKKLGYGNFKYSYFDDQYVLSDGVSATVTNQTIYFKLPEGMNPDKEIRCMQGYRYYGEYFFRISDDRTLCEYVGDNTWKYTLYNVNVINNEDYKNLLQGIIICQVEEDTVIDTGMILLDKDKSNNMLTIGERKLNKKGNPTENDYYEPIYEYEWTKYEE